MNTIKSAALLWFLIILSSCATVDTRRATYQTVPPVYAWMQDPPVGRPAVARVGQVMISESLAAVFDGFISTEDHEIPLDDAAALFPKKIVREDEFIIWGLLPGGDVMIRNMVFARAVLDEPAAGKLELTLIARKNGEVYGYAPFAADGLEVRKLEPAIRLMPQKVSVAGDFRQDWVYRGRNGDVVTLACLEYLDDMAKPSARQTLTYNLAASKTINCKGALIDVLDADKDQISFIVARYIVD